MNPIALVVRQSRAVVMITALVAAAGLLTGFSLPSDIYPPLQFPRIVVIAHAGMTPADSMVLTVTRPIEQAIMEVPGIRRVRSRTFRGAVGSLGAVRSRHQHGGGAAAGAEPGRRGAARHAAGSRSDRRSIDADGVSISHARSDRRPLVGRPARLRVLRDAAGILARRRRRPGRSPRERHARDRGDHRSGPHDRGRA